MLDVDVDTIRRFVHVLAATVWVGGQLTLAGLVPTLRAAGDDVPRAVARAFNRVAWPAFGVLVATGVWNLVEVDVGDTSTEYQATLGLKLVLVAASGVGAWLHTQARTRVGTAVWGAVGGLGAVVAVLFGVMLAGGS